MINLASRMTLLFKKSGGELYAAEIACIMGETYDDVCGVLGLLTFKGLVHKRETRQGYAYSLNTSQI